MEEKSREELQYQITKLQNQVSDLSVKNEVLYTENIKLQSSCRDLKDENKRLLNAVENLSIGFAKMQEVKK